MSRITETLSQSVLLLAAVLLCGTSAKASLLVYEGFNGYSTGLLSGQNVSANVVGLSGSYATASANGLTYNASSLTFGSYAVAGGSATWSMNGAGGVGATLSLSSPYVGTLYGSYLINLGASPTSDASRAEVRINSSTSGSTSTSYYNASAVATTGVDTSIKYSSGVLTTSNVMAANTTYMVISKWLNVGGTGSGQGTLWVLSAAQYTTLLGANHLTDSYLSTAVVGTDVTEMVTSSIDSATAANFSNSSALQFVFSSGAAGTVRTVDEVKYGSSLLDVTAVPEPTSMALLCGAVVVLAVSLRQRRLRA